jgi:hypothetical protein
MKLTIKKQVEQEIELNLPIYRKNAVHLTRVDEKNVVNVYKDSIFVHTFDENSIGKYYEMTESTKDEFDKAINEAINNIIKLK